MMMVVAVMAEALHLYSKVRGKLAWCQINFFPRGVLHGPYRTGSLCTCSRSTTRW